jgi:hypothetical protein
MIGFLALPDGNHEIDDNVFMLTLSKNNYYMQEYLEFYEKDFDIIDPSIAKYSIFTNDKKMFNPWNDMHHLILNSSILDYSFTINDEIYTKKKYFFELKKKNNALLLEEPFITEILYDLGFSGFHSDDRGYRLYNIFEPYKYLTFLEKQPYYKP